MSFDDMAISDSTVVATYQNAAVSATITTEGAGLIFSKGIVENPKAHSPNRIAVKLDKPVQKGAITITFKINK